jgi:uncharacterized protein (DUF433 family)
MKITISCSHRERDQARRIAEAFKTLAAVTAGTEVKVEDLPVPYSALLEFAPAVSDLSPCVKGTKLTANFVASLVVDGWTWHQIKHIYSALTDDDIRACLEYVIEGDQDGPDEEAVHRTGRRKASPPRDPSSSVLRIQPDQACHS